MASFEKPADNQLDMTLPTKRKRTLNPKLMSEDNVHEDAVKRRRAQQVTTAKQSLHSATKRSKEIEVARAQQRAPSPQPETDRDTEKVEVTSSSGSDCEASNVRARSSVEAEEIGLQEESDEQELGKLEMLTP